MEHERNENLAYLQTVLDELHAQGMEELVFAHHLIGWLSADIDEHHWRAGVDAALQAALRHRSMHP